MKHHSVKTRLVFIIALTASIVLCSASALFYAYEIDRLKRSMQENLTVQSNIIADNSKAAIVFIDTSEAQRLLSSLMHATGILEAVIVSVNGHFPETLARYSRHPGKAVQTEIDFSQNHSTPFEIQTPDYLLRVTPVILKQRTIGYVLLYSDYAQFQALRADYAALTTLVITAGLILALILAQGLQRVITRPLATLVHFVDQTTLNSDYSLGLHSHSSFTELNRLTTAFNSLLANINATIRERDIARHSLQLHNEQLEQQITLRTRQLAKAKDAAEASSTAKSVFLANMSHEIRTPINAILGFSKLLRTKLKDKQQQKQVDHILDASDMLMHLINDHSEFFQTGSQ